MKKLDINVKNESYKERIADIAKQDYNDFLAKELEANSLNEVYESRTRRVEKFGLNKIQLTKFNYFKEFFSAFIEPFNVLLIVIGFVNLFLYLFWEQNIEELVGFVLVFSMVLLSVITDFIQEVKSYHINKELHILVENEYFVIDASKVNFNKIDNRKILDRHEKIKEFELTIGDVLYFSVGDVIPSDCKIIWSNNLSVDQSQLTGESVYVEKNHQFKETENFIEYQNILYAQSIVKTGSCIAIIINVAENNFVGMISKYTDSKKIKTDFDKGISKVTKIILLIIFCAFVLIMIASSLRTGSWVNGAILAITIVVALTPEALPAIISGNLQVGSKSLSKHNIVVKDFEIIQNLGSVDVFTTDKTGTLTNEKILLETFHDFDTCGNKEIAELFYLNSKFQSSMNNAIDNAIIEYGTNLNFEFNNFEFVAENEFSFEKRMISVLLKNNLTKRLIQITKGSFEEMIKCITHIDIDGKISKITDEQIKLLRDDAIAHGESGKRTIIIATKETTDQIIKTENMVYRGCAVFDDAIKTGVNEAINKILNNGIEIKILSGDSLNVTKNVASRIGMDISNGVTGIDLKDEHNHQIINDENVFTKLNPIQKGNIVSCLQETKKVVSYLGDGANDVLALKFSDVGISVNNGSSSAKLAANIIMLEKDLDVLNSAFLLGRKTFYNALKFIKLTIATNMGLMLSMLITSLVLTFRAMIPIQLLIQNLLFDFSNLFFVFDKVDNISIQKPMKWNIRTFVPYVFFIAIISCGISLANIFISRATGILDMNANNFEQQQQTIFCIESFITHMMIILICRTERVSFVKSNASLTMYCGIAFLFGILMLFVYTPYISNAFDFSAPKPIWWLLMGGVILATWALLETEKVVYKKIYKSWI
jgi:Mg2+-importing ATPase